MDELFLGWDVGGWNCDKNPRSRDALAALVARRGRLELVGTPWRGNLRESLTIRAGTELLDDWLGLLGVDRKSAPRVTIAIDTPLTWPLSMLELVNTGRCADVPRKADHNPYLFRPQELALFERGLRPLSAVRDMIGSQSTKGIHFLQRTRLALESRGIWEAPHATALETYPAVVRKDRDAEELTQRILSGVETGRHKAPWIEDVRDAIACAVVAAWFRREPTRLAPPPEGTDAREGWIWLPR